MNQPAINALNLIKTFGACLVVASHYAGAFFGQQFFSFGTGCFFIVAGYYALNWERSRGLTYLGKRLIRLYPGYVVAIMAYLVVKHPPLSAWPELLLHHLVFLLSASQVETVFALNPAFWSMPVFLTFFVIVAFLPRRTPRFRGVVVLAILPFLVLFLGGMAWRNGYLELLAFPLHLFAFWLGGAVGQRLHNRPLRSQSRYTWLALALAIVTGIAGAYHHELGHDQLSAFIYREIMAGIYGLLLWSVLHSPLVNRESRLLNFTGSISFGVYLFHNLPTHLISPHLTGGAGASTSLALAIVLAWLSLRYVERPAQAYLKPRLMRYALFDKRSDKVG